MDGLCWPMLIFDKPDVMLPKDEVAGGDTGWVELVDAHGLAVAGVEVDQLMLLELDCGAEDTFGVAPLLAMGCNGCEY